MVARRAAAAAVVAAVGSAFAVLGVEVAMLMIGGAVDILVLAPRLVGVVVAVR